MSSPCGTTLYETTISVCHGSGLLLQLHTQHEYAPGRNQKSKVGSVTTSQEGVIWPISPNLLHQYHFRKFQRLPCVAGGAENKDGLGRLEICSGSQAVCVLQPVSQPASQPASQPSKDFMHHVRRQTVCHGLGLSSAVPRLGLIQLQQGLQGSLQSEKLQPL